MCVRVSSWYIGDYRGGPVAHGELSGQRGAAGREGFALLCCAAGICWSRCLLADSEHQLAQSVTAHGRARACMRMLCAPRAGCEARESTSCIALLRCPRSARRSSAPIRPSQVARSGTEQGVKVPLSGVTYWDPGARAACFPRRRPTSAWTVCRVTQVKVGSGRAVFHPVRDFVLTHKSLCGLFVREGGLRGALRTLPRLQRGPP